MIGVTQEMRDTAYREEGIIPYLKDTIRKVNEDEFRRAGADPVGICRAKERELASHFVEPLRELIHALDHAEEVADEEALINAVNEICFSLVTVRSVDRGCSIMERYHRENGKDLKQGVAEILIRSSGTGFDAKSNSVTKKTHH